MNYSLNVKIELAGQPQKTSAYYNCSGYLHLIKIKKKLKVAI